MFKPNHNVEPVEVLTQPEQRRRRSVEEKLAIVRETFEPGATVSGVARRHQVNANQVFAGASSIRMEACRPSVLANRWFRHRTWPKR